MMEKKTPLYESHVALGAKMVEFGGFLMPVQYPTGILAEHMAVREKAGLFDVSHMGELVFHGEDALENIQHLVTTDISKMLDGDMRYGMFCNDEGGVVDDLIVYRMAQDDYLIVVNAGNRDKDAAWVETHLSGHPGYHDAGNEFGQIAVQGPVSKEILVKLCDEAALPVKYYSFTKAVLTWNGRSAETYVSRSGYTGSFGYEILCKAEDTVWLWNTLLEAAGTVLETKKTSIGGAISGETFQAENVTFSRLGTRVVVRAAVPGNDLLTFEGLAVGLGDFTANGTNYTYTLQNDSGATSTLVTAVSGSGEPVSINGQALSTGGSATVAIPNSGTTDIVVGIGAKTYTLTILRNSGTGGNEGGGGGSSSPSYSITVDKTKNGTITVSPRNASHGDIVTITATPDKGYELEMLKVLDRSGDALKLTEKNGKYTFKMPSGKVTIKASFVEEVPEQIFKDVPANAYYYEAVKWAQEKGITGGIGNGLFGPNDPCTRAQIVTFLWRAAGSPAPKNTGTAFGDVKLGSFYEQAVAWAVENGITGGTGEGMFSPDATCTRAQSVTFLYRAAGSPVVSGSAEFGDVSTTAFYADAVAWAAKKGITTGIGGGLFGSDNDCTRGQIVTFLWRCKK